MIIGGFNLDKGRLSRCYREISNQTVPSCSLMLFQAHKTKRELEETWQNEEDTVEQKHPGTEKPLPLREAKSHKAVHAAFTIAITQRKCSFLFFVNTTVTQKLVCTVKTLLLLMQVCCLESTVHTVHEKLDKTRNAAK